MPTPQVTLGVFGSAIYRESDGALVAFFAEHSAAVAACAEGQTVTPAVITRSGIVPAPTPTQTERTHDHV